MDREEARGTTVLSIMEMIEVGGVAWRTKYLFGPCWIPQRGQENLGREWGLDGRDGRDGGEFWRSDCSSDTSHLVLVSSVCRYLN